MIATARELPNMGYSECHSGGCPREATHKIAYAGTGVEVKACQYHANEYALGALLAQTTSMDIESDRRLSA